MPEDSLPTETQKAYLAGFFDGEGSVGIRRRSAKQVSPNVIHVLNLAVGGTDPTPLWMLKSFYGGYIYESNKKRRADNPRFKKSWTWQLESRKAEKFLIDILPYAVVKKGQILTALEYRRVCHSPKLKVRLTKRDIAIAENFKLELEAQHRANFVM